MPTLLKAALTYAARGWRVFPLNGKAPFSGTNGHLDATIDRKQILRWWRKEFPGANIGIACSSKHGPIVIDIDGDSGHELAEKLGLRTTKEAVSRPGRLHMYYDPLLDGTKVPRTIKVKYEGVKHAFDILGDGGYVVAPPSIHPKTGKKYEWRNESSVSRLPKSILRLVKTNGKLDSSSSNGAAPLPSVISEGERDNLLTSLAGSMRRRGASEDAILAALREENATRVDPPLPDKDLRRIAKSIARKPPAGHGEHYTDLGNARRFIAQHHGSVRAVGTGRRPYRIWDGTRWVPDETGEIERYAKNTVRALYSEAAHISDPELREKLLKHASHSESAARIRAILELASTEPEISTTIDQFDADPWLLNVENGTLDLKTGKLLPHRKEDLMSKLAPVEFDPKAKAPRWDQFMLEVMNGDEDLVQFLQRAVGYSLTGSIREQCLFFLYGTGANGKSTFLDTLRTIFGDYAQQADFNTFLARKSEGPRNDLARMRGARLVSAIEAHGERGFDETVLKQLTGGDTIVARKLYEELFEFDPTHKLFLAANHKPVVREHTEAFWRRIRLVPFTVVFTAEERDKKLDIKLGKELPGILNWALEGCLEWRKEGLMEPRAVKRATKGYREENDVLAEFLSGRCRFKEGEWSSMQELYKVFVEWWFETRGARSTPLSLGWFGRLMSERAEIQGAKQEGIRGWEGITVKENFKL